MEETHDPVRMPVEQALATAQLATDRAEAFGAEVREQVSRGPAPEALHGIELWGVGRKPLDREPMPRGGEEGTHLDAAVRVEVVPDQMHGSAELPAKMLEEADQVGCAHALALEGEEHARRTAQGAWGVAERPDRRQPCPATEAMLENRRLAPPRPGGAHGRNLGEAALVEEDDQSSAARGVFFTRGQRSRTQRAIAASSRSLARVVVFWREKPS